MGRREAQKGRGAKWKRRGESEGKGLEMGEKVGA